MNPNPSNEDIQEAVCGSVGGPPERFVYAEGSEERGEGQNDSTGFWHGESEYPDPDAYRHTMPRNPELDRIQDQIRGVLDWPRQNLEEMKRLI